MGSAYSSSSEQPPIYDCWPRPFLGGTVCEPRPTEPRRRSPILVAAGPQPTYQLRGGVLQARTNIAGGQLVIRGQPAKHPTRALLSYRPSTALGPAPCSARLFRDGTELTVHESVRAGNHEELLTIDVSALRQLEASTRFAGEICGKALELDAPARGTLSQFEARFREERSKLDNPVIAQPLRSAPLAAERR